MLSDLKGKKNILLQVQGLRSKVQKPRSQASVICFSTHQSIRGQISDNVKAKGKASSVQLGQITTSMTDWTKKTCKL